ncbi:PREDICTED: deleted in azoospermia-like [Dipodomys ordii]|uniref:Deleted in azoospermia-like n=1 Tax=Dipodomys ordii TaxID=10020 RepID=A0A1S3FNG3_DIPOR|nr:PREDICTED: deleted in azoospermia-like [Dipodomys ordii]
MAPGTPSARTRSQAPPLGRAPPAGVSGRRHPLAEKRGCAAPGAPPQERAAHASVRRCLQASRSPPVSLPRRQSSAPLPPPTHWRPGGRTRGLHSSPRPPLPLEPRPHRRDPLPAAIMAEPQPPPPRSRVKPMGSSKGATRSRCLPAAVPHPGAGWAWRKRGAVAESCLLLWVLPRGSRHGTVPKAPATSSSLKHGKDPGGGAFLRWHQMDETEIRSFFARYGSVKEVKIITDRTGVSKGYGFVSFYNDVDVQKIIESQINFHGKKLKLGPAIRKQNLCAYHVQPRPLIFNPPPPPQFQSVWSNPNTETYMPPPTMMNPITQYVQAYPPYPSSPVQVITGYQLPVYNYQIQPQWPTGEQRSYVIPPAYTAVNYHCNEVDPGTEVMANECSVHEATPSSGNGPQKKSVDRSIQTVVSCLFNPENRLRNSLVTQDDYFKDKRVHHFRRSRAVLKSV